jgi:hypothetical protein
VSVMFPKLEGLDSLARRDGVDIRPTLVRVLTDLYTQKPAHSSEEERHYTELVLRLIDSVDEPTRATVARKLAHYPGAPPAIVRRLARDTLTVAGPILRDSAALSTSDLEAIVRDCGWDHAAIVAARRDAPKIAARVDAAPTPERAREGSGDITMANLFFSADPEARRTLLLSLGDADTEAVQSVQPVETIRALEAAALGRDRTSFVRLLEGALSLLPTQADQIVRDQSGEPLLVACKALAMPPVVLQRILMFIDPAIGESVHKVFNLAAFYERMSMDAAHKIIESMRGHEPVAAKKRAPQHRPMYYDDEAVRGRRGVAARRAGKTETQAPARSEPGKTQRTM